MSIADCRLHVPKLHCQPGDGVLDCKGSLSNTISPNSLAEVNKVVKLAATVQK